MENCKQTIESYLSNVPQEWRSKVADILCQYLANQDIVSCGQIKACQTTTSLSEFTINGTQISITYVNEKGINVTRTFNFSTLLNESLDTVDPLCITTPEAWFNATDVGRWQSMIDKLCDCCNPTTTSTTTTTTIPPTCDDYSMFNPNVDPTEFSYTDCDGVNHVINLQPGEIIEFCALSGTIIYPNSLVLTFFGDCNPICPDITDTQFGITTTTTTTVPELYYWGFKPDNTVLTPTQIVASPFFNTFVPGSTLIADYTSNNQPQFLWMAEPSSEPLKTKWFGDFINNGNIGGASDLFFIPILSGGFRFYITQYLTENENTPIEFRVS